MISELIRDDLKDFLPYETAKLVSDVSYVRLHANESPWSLSDDNLNRYPKQLRKEIPSRYFGIKPEELLITRGSNEGIDLLMRLFCKAGKDEVSIITPTFGMYKNAAKIQGIKINSIELKENEGFNFDSDRIIREVNKKTKLLFICTPNNPTGNSMSVFDIEKICTSLQRKCIVVVDEAYIEFSEGISATTIINKYENLVVLRTLSKAFALAGVRGGFVIANEKMINAIQLIQLPYCIPTPCIQIIENAMNNEKIVKMWINTTVIKNSRRYLISKFNEMAVFEKVYPSETNFVLIKLKNADELEKVAEERGILLRKISGLNNYLRISVGDFEENQALLETILLWRMNCE